MNRTMEGAKIIDMFRVALFASMRCPLMCDHDSGTRIGQCPFGQRRCRTQVPYALRFQAVSRDSLRLHVEYVEYMRNIAVEY
jgi:hypothetical protein